MHPNKSTVGSGFSPSDMTSNTATNNAARYRVAQSDTSSVRSTYQAAHSETDDTDDNDDDHRRGGVSLIDHPDPSPSPSLQEALNTKSRKRSRRGAAKRAMNAQGGVPSSIPEEIAQTSGPTDNHEKKPEGQAVGQEGGDDNGPVVTPFMHRRAQTMARQGIAGAHTGPRAPGFTPTRFNGGQRIPPVGTHIQTTTPSSQFGGPQYGASNDGGVFVTPAASASRLTHLRGGMSVSAAGVQAGGPRPGPHQEGPFARLSDPKDISSGVSENGPAGPADVMYRVPAPGNPGAHTEPRRLYQQSRAPVPGTLASPPQYQTPTGPTSHHQFSASATFGYQGQRHAMTTPGPAQDLARFAAAPTFAPPANKMVLDTADTPTPLTVVRVTDNPNFKMLAPPSNNALFQTSGVPTQPTIAARSDLLNELTNTSTGLPSPDVALSDRFFPFEYCWAGVSDGMDRGVIRIKNVPYATTRSEVIAMLGRNTKILNDADEGVHIIMERLNSKTNDIFIELINMREASKTVQRFDDLARKRRFPRLGDRIVDIVESNQSELMREMFPTARGIKWNGTTPVMQKLAPKQTWRVFKGFINDEEFAMMNRYVESPMRAPFARDCPQRPYEFQISTLKKLPWHVPDLISFRQRWMLYYYTERLVETLRSTLDNPKHDQAVSPLTEQLLKRLHAACMVCPGFSAAQKNNLSIYAGYEESIMGAPKTSMPMPMAGDELAMTKVVPFDRNEAVDKTHLPKNPFLWNHLHALRPKAGIPFDVLEWYIATIREATLVNSIEHMNFDEQRIAGEMEQKSQGTGYFGRLWCEVGFSTYALDKLGLLKLREVGERELDVVKQVIARALDTSMAFPAHLQVCA